MINFSGKYAVQKPTINYVCEQKVKYGSTQYPGWTYIKPEEIENYRSSNTQIILDKIFLPKIRQFNPFFFLHFPNSKLKREILQAIDEKIQKEEAKKKGLENLFKSILSELMSGSIRVKFD